LFFNPGFSLWKKKIGDTEYGLGWIPFGGYVKISGMIDESMDKEQMNKAPESFELRSKPAYQRLIVMLGGVIVNVILAIVIFIGIAWFWGDDFLPAKNLSYGIHPTEISKKMGLQDGDIIVALDQKELKDFFELESKIVLEDPKTIQVKRGDSVLSLAIPTTIAAELANANNSTAFVVPMFPVIVDSIGKTAVVVEGSFQKNDTLLSINGQSVKYQHEFIEVKKKYSDSLVTILAKRGMDTVKIRTLINNKAQLGLFVKLPMQLFKTVHQEYSFAEAIPTGIQRCFTTLDNYVTGIKQIFTGNVNPNDSLGSLISIGNTFPSQWDWERFWTLTAVFSIVLGFMNVLPIPALDGGHALFILFEMITGRKPSDKFMEYAQIAGMILMFGLMLYALGLDFWRLFN
jgi:regulator of sigma E protease